MSDLRIVPVSRDQAFDFITAWHRHHAPPQGFKFAVGVALAEILVGVATVGRPVARFFDDGMSLEVTRLATDGTSHACSALYAACWRAAKAIGYRRILTYTQEGESGSSLRAAGWIHAATRSARSGWDTPTRRRDNAEYGAVGRLLWVVESNVSAELPSRVSQPAQALPEPTLFDFEVAA
ncbi:XF1762 family protein [Micromonosporaceae bacterium Da 78-11]